MKPWQNMEREEMNIIVFPFLGKTPSKTPCPTNRKFRKKFFKDCELNNGKKMAKTKGPRDNLIYAEPKVSRQIIIGHDELFI